MKRWKISGLIATIVIILTIPLYLLKEASITSQADGIQPKRASVFVGSTKCMDCHKKEYDKWQGSHHDHAMAVANDETVLGDFNKAVFEIHGVTSRFYRKEGKFFVYTEGPDGKMGEFEITHTFGWHPLQQYLVPFPGGAPAVPSHCLGCERKKVVPPLSKGAHGPEGLAVLDQCRPELEWNVRRMSFH